MRFKSYIEQLSKVLIKVGWYIVRYDHWIESGQFRITFQKVVNKRTSADEPFQLIITKDVIVDELDIYHKYVRLLNREIFDILAIEDLKA